MHCKVCNDVSYARLPVGGLARDGRSNTAPEHNRIGTWSLKTAVKPRKCSSRHRGQVSSGFQSSLAGETQVQELRQTTADVLSIIRQRLPYTSWHTLARKFLLWPACCIRAV